MNEENQNLRSSCPLDYQIYLGFCFHSFVEFLQVLIINLIFQLKCEFVTNNKIQMIWRNKKLDEDIQISKFGCSPLDQILLPCL